MKGIRFFLVLGAAALLALGARAPLFAQCDPDGDNSDQDIECSGNDPNGVDARGGDDTVDVNIGSNVTGDVSGGAGEDSIENNGNINGNVLGNDDSDVITNNNTVTGDLNGDDFAAGSSGNDVITNNGVVGDDIWGQAGNDTITNDGSVGDIIFGGSGSDTITNDGIVAGEGITGESGHDTINNTGLVNGVIVGGSGNDIITNNGEVGDSINGDEGNDIITNSGDVGDSINGDIGNDIITNSGDVGGGIFDWTGDNVITNTESGTVQDGIETGDGNDTITNDGVVFNDIFTDDGDDTINNGGGTVIGDVSAGDGNDTVSNDGTIAGDVTTGLGEDHVVNIGTVVGDIVTQEDDDFVQNDGTVEDILTGTGQDTIQIGNGAVVTGVIDGGSGFDQLVFAFTGVSRADAAFIQSVINAANANPGAPGSLDYLGRTYEWQHIEELVNMIRIIAHRSGGKVAVQPSSNSSGNSQSASDPAPASQDMGIVSDPVTQASIVQVTDASQPFLFCQDNFVNLFRQPGGAVDVRSRSGNVLIASIPAGTLTSGMTFQSVGGGNPGYLVRVQEIGTGAFQTLVGDPSNRIVSNGCTFVQTTQGPLVIVGGSSTLPIQGIYVVRDGDTLFRIALNHGTTVDRLAALNNITNRNLIYPGQALRIG